MMLADARLPVAGHTQSGTLEGALANGLDPADVPAYLRSRLWGAIRVEAGTAVAARHAARGGADLAGVDRAWAARTVSPALRDAARLQGQALLRLAVRVWPGAVGALEVVTRPSRSTVLGTLAGHLDIGAASLARLVAYDDVQTVCAAALKLVPLDPVVVTGWVHDALDHVDDVVRAVADVQTPDEIPAVASPQIEAWAQAHAGSSRRLFRA
ncbi:hypothetical protein ASD81_23565 [Nocardioides sp. Root614]|nr:hypothetical protein ASD81_23565 [Nocardioides sp. Root614]KRA86223.1 hypothetical protein ASD84_23805 [Nocardioides sp. Root682]